MRTLEETAELLQRTQEIKVLSETQDKARVNIDKKQITQQKNQNEQHNVQIDRVPNGTTVLVKNEGILQKLDARYKGPFKIIGITSNLNYELEDATGTYPLHKLKIVEQNLVDNYGGAKNFKP